MSEFDFGSSERFHHLFYFLENNLVTNLIRHITVKTGSLEW